MPDCVETGVYNVDRGVPWHTLGTANQGFMTAWEVLDLAQLRWRVEKVGLYIKLLTEYTAQEVMTSNGLPVFGYLANPITYKEIPDNYAIVRETDKKVLGVVGNRYEPAQNEDVLAFMDNLVGSGQAIYDTAWSLRGGKTVCLTAELEQCGRLPRDEEMRTYVTVMNTHDGSGQITIVVSPIRVVCWNTLNMALNNAKFAWKRKHTLNAMSVDSLAAARETLSLATTYQQHITDVANDLMGQTYNRREFEELATTLLFADPLQPTPQENAKYEALMDVYSYSDNLNNIRGTKWGALNAVAEHIDYFSRYRGNFQHDKRAEAILLGKGVDMKTKAYELLVA